MFLCGDLNARLHRRRPGEETALGEHIFGNPHAQRNPVSNRSFLLELCFSRKLYIGNTMFDEPVERRITCYNVGSSPADPPIERHFGQIDFILVSAEWKDSVQRVWSDRTAALASHHFLVQAELQVEIQKATPSAPPTRRDISALREPALANSFNELFTEHMVSHCSGEDVSAHQLNEKMISAFRDAADRCLPEAALRPKRPWISEQTLAIIRERNDARSRGLLAQERALTQRVKASVKADRTRWLEDSLATGDWTQIRQLRKSVVPRQGRLQNLGGELVDSDTRADTLAEYFSRVQWAVRPTTVAGFSDSLGAALPVSCQDITEDEVVRAAAKLKAGRATGKDDVPAEFWKAVCIRETEACRWAVALCNKCWRDREVPEPWHEALVAAIFKKGDVAKCENYRPVSLLSVGYKIFAAILLNRLKDGGAEGRVWATQFGFKSRHGTADAIFLVRRLLERTWAEKNGSLVVLIIAWANYSTRRYTYVHLCAWTFPLRAPKHERVWA